MSRLGYSRCFLTQTDKPTFIHKTKKSYRIAQRNRLSSQHHHWVNREPVLSPAHLHSRIHMHLVTFYSSLSPYHLNRQNIVGFRFRFSSESIKSIIVRFFRLISVYIGNNLDNYIFVELRQTLSRNVLAKCRRKRACDTVDFEISTRSILFRSRGRGNARSATSHANRGDSRFVYVPRMWKFREVVRYA